MREKIRDKERLEHISSAIKKLLKFNSEEALDRLEFDTVEYYGVVKLLEIIGEAVYKLSKEFRESHDDVDWDEIEGMRHVLVHGYYQIRLDDVICAIKEDLPDLQIKIGSILEDEK